MSNGGDLLARIVNTLNEAGIPYMVAGSFALDVGYIERWATDLGVLELWNKVLGSTGAGSPGTAP